MLPKRLIYLMGSLLIMVHLCGCSGLSHRATIKVTSNPSGADLYDETGRYWGTTPMTLTRTHWTSGETLSNTFTFELPGYQRATRTLSYRVHLNNPSYAVHANLVEIRTPSVSEPTYYSVQHTLTTDPNGSAVYINQDFMGHTPLSIELTWSSRGDNRKELRFEKYGYQTNRRMITPNDKRIHVVMQ